MGIFDGLKSWGSSVFNTISSGVSSVVSGASSVFSGVTSAVTSTVSNASSFVSSTVSSAGNAVGGWAQGASSYVSNQVSKAAENAANAADGARKAAESVISGITGGTTQVLTDANKRISEARKQVDAIIASGGTVSANVLNQLGEATDRLAEAQRKVTSSNTWGGVPVPAIVQVATPVGILSGVTSAVLGGIGAINNYDEIKKQAETSAKDILNAVKTTTENTFKGFSDLVGGGNGILSVSPTPKVDLTKLDYSNPDVMFTDDDGNDRGHLGQYASPYAVANDAVFFNTGGIRGGSNAPANMSSWTDTPDDQKLHDYGLSGNVVYTSRDLDSGEQRRVLDLYREKGWLNETTSTITDRATKAVQVQYINRTLERGSSSVLGGTTGGTVQRLETVAADTNLKYNFAGDPAGAAVGVTTAALGSIPGAMSGLADGIIGVRNEWLAEGVQSVQSGYIASAGTVKGAVSVGAEIIAPLDLMNVVNLWMTGRGDQIELEDLGYAALDAVALGAGAVTGGAGYLGIKALKGAAKGAKVVKNASYAGQAGLTGVIVMGG